MWYLKPSTQFCWCRTICYYYWIEEDANEHVKTLLQKSKVQLFQVLIISAFKCKPPIKTMPKFVHAVPVVFPSLIFMLEMCHFSLKWWWTSSTGTTLMLSLKTATNSIMKPWRWPSMSSPRARRCTWPSGSKPSTRASRCGANKNVRDYCSGDNKGIRRIMCVIFHHCTLDYTIAAFTVLYVEKTWVQKKE